MNELIDGWWMDRLTGRRKRRMERIQPTMASPGPFAPIPSEGELGLNDPTLGTSF